MGWELFKNYLIAKEKFQPDFFLYENNKSAAQAIKDQIAEEFGVGVDPDVRFTYINSALVSAQNRQRFYVTNFGDIEQPEDRGILLKDILETGQARYDKSPCLDANYYKGGNLTRPECQSGQRLMACEPIYIGAVPENNGTYLNGKQPSQQYRIYDTEGKGVSVTTSAITNVVEPVGTTPDGKSFAMTSYYSTGQNAPHTLEKHIGSMVAEPVGAIPVNETADGKAHCVRATCYKDGVRNLVGNDCDKRTGIAEPVCVAQRGRYETADGTVQKFEARGDGKTNTLTTVQKDNAIAEPVGTTKDGKAYCLTSGYSNGSGEKIGNYAAHTLEKGCESMVAEPIQVGSLPRPNGELSTSQAMRIYSTDGKGVTQSACGGGLGGKTGLYAMRVDEPMRVKEATKQGYVDINVGDCVDLSQPNSNTRRGRSLTDKSNCLTTSNQMYEYCGVLGYATPVEWDDNGVPTKAISCADGKTYTVYEVKDGLITIKDKQYPIKLIDGYYIIRKLTVTECARLQTMPDDYCKAVSDSQAYKALGNGWTAEVIIHLLNHALKDVPRDEEIVVLSMYDGIATGRYCLDKMGFTNVTYHAYEIDKYPIQVAMDNYPDIIQHGDAFAVREDDWEPPKTRAEWLDDLLGGDL